MSRLSTFIAIVILTGPMSLLRAADEPADPGLNEDTFAGLKLRSLGPAFMSGRISDIAVDPQDRRTRYVGAGSGGIFKTVNAGTTWTPIFEDESAYSIGCITIDPSNSNTIWVGTGENVSGRHVGFGDGIYRSLDGGTTWTNMGLAKSEHIGMIRIDPRDSNILYVAVQGPLWSGGGDRGLYKTDDGGQTWSKILGGGEYTGVGEVHMDPRNPDVLYANTWQRLRSVAGLMDGGPETAIHKSTDAGVTWKKLSEGLPEEYMGKIGLAISPQKPDVIYAQIELAQRSGGFWRSEDGGESWEKRSDYMPGGTGPHYYQEIFASPHQFDVVYQMDVYLHYTVDGGKNFIKSEYNKKHVDHHALVFDPDDPDYLLVGNDGGIYESFDKGENWRFSSNLPITQYYKVAVDYDEPFYNVYGGTQDNNSQGGPSRTDNNVGIRNSDWFVTLGGDGHQSAADPTNPDIVYAQWQQGNLARFDRRTGESVSIKPQPARGEPTERFNWDSPILISPHDPARLYFASQRVWRSDDRGDSWRAISGDLSRNIDRFKEALMGRQWSFDSPWDLYAMSKFSTITSLAESPLVEGLLYAGTDDGVVQVTEDGGANWRQIAKPRDLPDNFFVNDLKADLFDPDTVYLVADNHKAGDFRPLILKSADRGRSWKPMHGDLPERHITWRLVQDHVNSNLFFAGTEFGLFFSIDGGKRWTKLSGGVPNIPFRDIVIQSRENDLVGATFGRGFYVFDDYTPLRTVTEKQLKSVATLFKPRAAPWYMPRKPLGCNKDGCVASHGAQFYRAENPPFGAIFTYYLPEEIRSRKDQRREQEKSIEKVGGNTPSPGWDALSAEENEDPPSVVLTVRDSDNNVVRHIAGPVEAGFQRVAWNLRYPDGGPWDDGSERSEFDPLPVGVMVAPGQYTVTLAIRIDGKPTIIGDPQSFDVVSIRRDPVLAGSAQDERVRFARERKALARKSAGDVETIEELLAALSAVKEVLLRTTGSASLYERTNALGKQFTRLRETLAGNEQREIANDPGPVSIMQRLGSISMADRATLYGPTATQRQNLEIAADEHQAVSAELTRLITADLARLKADLDLAGTPWAPGLGILRTPTAR